MLFMKNLYISATGKQVIITAIITFIVAAITIFLLATNTIPPFLNASWMLVTYFTIVFIFCVASCLLFFGFGTLLVVGLICNYYFNRKEQKAEKLIGCTLSHEFKKVYIKDPTILYEMLNSSNESCQARLDEKGEIVFEIEIHAKAQGHTNDYSYFLDKFDIP